MVELSQPKICKPQTGKRSAPQKPYRYKVNWSCMGWNIPSMQHCISKPQLGPFKDSLFVTCNFGTLLRESHNTGCSLEWLSRYWMPKTQFKLQASIRGTGQKGLCRPGIHGARVQIVLQIYVRLAQFTFTGPAFLTCRILAKVSLSIDSNIQWSKDICIVHGFWFSWVLTV